MHQPVPIAGHIPQKTGFPFPQYSDVSKLDGNIFVFDDRTPEALGQDMTAKVQQRLQPSSQIRLGRRHRSRITLKGLETFTGQRPEAFNHPPDPRGAVSNDGRADP